MATYTIGTDGDFATIDAYKTAGISDGDVLDIISDIDDSSSNQTFGFVDNLTITSSLDTKPYVQVNGYSLRFGGFPFDQNNLNIEISNLNIDLTDGTGPGGPFGAIYFDTYDASGLRIINNTIKTSAGVFPRTIALTGPDLNPMSDIEISGNIFDSSVNQSGPIFLAPLVLDGSLDLKNNTFFSYGLHFDGTVDLANSNNDVASLNITNNLIYAKPGASNTGTLNLLKNGNSKTVGTISGIGFYDGSGGSIVFNVDSSDTNSATLVVEGDPLFKDFAGGDYTYAKGSPMLKAGFEGLNIGWDQLTAYVPADRTLGQVKSMPYKANYAGDLIKDDDNGGGFEYTNTDDLASSIYRKRKPNAPTPNGYRALNGK